MTLISSTKPNCPFNLRHIRDCVVARSGFCNTRRTEIDAIAFFKMDT